MSGTKPCDEPLTIAVEDGQAVVEGGCGTAVTLTPDAAAASAENLLTGATELVGRQAVIDAQSRLGNDN